MLAGWGFGVNARTFVLLATGTALVHVAFRARAADADAEPEGSKVLTGEWGAGWSPEGNAHVAASPMWPSRFVSHYALHSAADSSKVINKGTYWYDWEHGKRMLIESSNCSGGATGKERRDIACDGVFRDGKLYAKGVAKGAEWCCKWHGDEFYPTPPYFLDQAKLEDGTSTFDGTPAAKWGPYLKGHAYYRLDDGTPLALDSGFGAYFRFSRFAKGHPIDPSKFDLPAGLDCEAACDWAALPFEDAEPGQSPAGAGDKACPVPKAERTGGKFDNPHCPAAWTKADREVG